MGELAEYYGEELLNEAIARSQRDHVERAYAQGYWVMKDGQRIRPRKMTDSHLVNTLRFIQRLAEQERKIVLSFYLDCKGPSGDMACDLFDREAACVIEADWTDYVPSIFEALEAEAERRGLTWDSTR